MFYCRIGRIQALSSNPESIRNEGEFFDAICRCDLETLSEFSNDPSRTSSFVNWEFVKRCAKAVTSTGSIDVLKVVVSTFCRESAKPTEVGEIFALETIASGRSSMVVGLLHHWVVTRDPLVSNINGKQILIWEEKWKLNKLKMSIITVMICIGYLYIYI